MNNRYFGEKHIRSERCALNFDVPFIGIRYNGTILWWSFVRCEFCFGSPCDFVWLLIRQVVKHRYCFLTNIEVQCTSFTTYALLMFIFVYCSVSKCVEFWCCCSSLDHWIRNEWVRLFNGMKDMHSNGFCIRNELMACVSWALSEFKDSVH